MWLEATVRNVRRAFREVNAFDVEDVTGWWPKRP
jgi:hypothetical protein